MACYEVSQQLFMLTGFALLYNLREVNRVNDLCTRPTKIDRTRHTLNTYGFAASSSLTLLR